MGSGRKVISYQEFSSHLAEVFEQVLLGEEVVVERGKGESVVLNLADSTNNGMELSPEKLAAFLSAAGGWAEMDTEAFKAQLRASRDMPPRTPVDL